MHKRQSNKIIHFRLRRSWIENSIEAKIEVLLLILPYTDKIHKIFLFHKFITWNYASTTQQDTILVEKHITYEHILTLLSKLKIRTLNMKDSESTRCMQMESPWSALSFWLRGLNSAQTLIFDIFCVWIDENLKIDHKIQLKIYNWLLIKVRFWTTHSQFTDQKCLSTGNYTWSEKKTECEFEDFFEDFPAKI